MVYNKEGSRTSEEQKECPSCEAIIDYSYNMCPFCGYKFSV